MPAIDRSFDAVAFLSEHFRDILRRRLSEIAGLALTTVALLAAIALATWSVQDPSLSHAAQTPVRNLLGFPGAIVDGLHVLEPDRAVDGLVRLDGEPLKSAVVEWVNKDQLRFVLKEGKKRQIRRMCEMVGLKVTGLKRVRIGRVLLSDLPVGQWRYLAEGEGF